MLDLQTHKTLSKFFLGLILGIIATLIFFRYNEGSVLKLYPKLIHHTDTTYLIGKHKPEKSVPVLIKTDTVSQKGDTVYLISDNYQDLKRQYTELLKKYTVRNIYIDSIMIGSYGHILVNDTIQYNTIKSRSFTESYKIPILSTTEYIISKPKSKFLIGGEINYHTFGNLSAETGLVYQNKKSNQYTLKIGFSNTGLYYGIGYYKTLNNEKITRNN